MQVIIYNVEIVLNNFILINTNPFATHACLPGGKRGGMVCKPLKVSTLQQWNAAGNRNLEENGLYTLLISRAGRDNWIGEAIVAQAIHEAIHYIHHRDSISNSSNYMCI